MYVYDIISSAAGGSGTAFERPMPYWSPVFDRPLPYIGLATTNNLGRETEEIKPRNTSNWAESMLD